ncbi:MAG: hypothetical protein QOF06_2382 [Solirubrobacterales bacterium]|jgi:predicted nucleic acid-binding protein|nr:hypothetical protein [Solirubrobacterales bacterium]
MHHAFISYARRDANVVERVVEGLERMDREVWIDRRDIPVSFPWLADVREAIAAADVFVEFRSRYQAASQACALESAAAAELGKQILVVPVDEGNPALAVREIAAALGHAGADGEGDRTELLVRARTWDRHGRPRGALPGRRPWRRLRSAASAGPRKLPQVTADFLRAARRRNRRRRIVALLGLTVIGVSILMISALSKVKEEEEKELDRTELLFSAALFSRLEAGVDVYGALRSGARRVHDPSGGFIAAEALQHGMNVRVPDFSRSSDGSAYGLEPRRAGAVPRALSADGALEAEGRSTDGRVDVRRSDGELIARLWLGGPTAALAFSPDGRLLAAAEGDAVGVYTVESGIRMGRLGGGRGAVQALRWSADGSRIWALSGRSRVSAWPWRSARILLDRPGLEFVKLGTDQGGRRVVGVDERGRLAILDPGGPARIVTTSAREVRGADFFGDEVAMSSENGVVVYELGSDRERSWRLADCLVTDVAYSRDGRRLYVGCANTGVRVFDARTAQRTGSIPILNGPIRLASLPGGELLVGSARGQGVLVHGDGTTEVLAEGALGEAMFAVAASESGDRALLGGLGAGAPFTLFAGSREGEGWHWDTVLADAGRYRAVAGAFSSNDRLMALGLESGRVLVRGRGAELGAGPDWSDLPGAAKGLAFAGGRLFVATSAGLIAVYENPCPFCDSPSTLAAEAQRRYRSALRMGLTERP